MKRTLTESLDKGESNNMQQCIALYKMATSSRSLISADVLALLDQQKELEEAPSTDLDADEDFPKVTAMEHRH